MLAGDETVLHTWFWSGFGMGTVDGVRGVVPLRLPTPGGYSVRAADETDVAALAVLDVEHNRHYTEPPVFMAERTPDDRAAWSAFIARDGNSAWIAEDAADRSGSSGSIASSAAPN